MQKIVNLIAIVLHGWDQVPDRPVFPQGTPEGWGCPAVSNSTMRYLDALLQQAPKPVLMWVRGSQIMVGGIDY